MLLHTLTLKCGSYFYGIYSQNFNSITSGCPGTDFGLSPRPVIYPYSVWQDYSFPWASIHHLSNSNNNICNVRLGYRFNENKHKTFHKWLANIKLSTLLPPLHPGLYISWKSNHLFLYRTLRILANSMHSISICWMNEWMNTWINKNFTNQQTNEWVNWYSTCDTQRYHCSVGIEF